MARPDVFDLALVAGCTALAGWTALAGDETQITGVFIAFVYSCLALLARAGVAGAVRVHREGRRARELAGTDPHEMAAAAITEERRRLAVDIGQTLRRAMGTISEQARTLDRGDPLPGLRGIHAQAQLATSELRLQLGLLRQPSDSAAPSPAQMRSGRLHRTDLWFAAGITLLAAVEATAYAVIEDKPWLPWSPVWTALAAATVVGRRRGLAVACGACAAVFLAASWHGYPVTGGFWLVGGLGVLLWSVAAHGRRWVELALGGLLVAAVSWSRWVDDRSNLPYTLVLMGVAPAAGLISRVVEHREEASRSRALAREAELTDATRVAVTAERSGFARDLHDVVSHAVGLIAMQAAAGQVSWPDNPEAIRRSVGLIESTARATLAELERLGGHPVPTHPGTPDLKDLVSRIRATGTSVDLTVVGEPPDALRPVVHRVVQEALTNAVRHAAGAPVEVTVRSTADDVRVRVADQGPASPTSGTRGFGLTGLRERVGLAGGTLTTGPGTDGGYLVDATLPVARPVAAP